MLAFSDIHEQYILSLPFDGTFTSKVYLNVCKFGDLSTMLFKVTICAIIYWKLNSISLGLMGKNYREDIHS